MKANKGKRMFAAGFVCALILSMGFQAYGAALTKTIQATFRDIKIYVDGELIETADGNGNRIEPFIYNGSTYLPVKAVSHALGMPVKWDNQTSSVWIGEVMPSHEEVTVSTAEELVQAIGSNKKIYLEPGLYDLTSLVPEYKPSSAQVYWEEVFDGYQLCLRDIKNLTIEGLGKEEVEIVVQPRYAFVMNFLDCSDIELVNLKAGHTEGGYCQGGVFGFTNSAHIRMEKVQMYGCGTEGLRLEGVSDMQVSDSTIYECTYDIMTIKQSSNILFESCTFRDNQEFTLISINDTEGVSFDDCLFTNNTSPDYPMFSTSLSKNITVKNSKFTGNEAKALELMPTINLVNNTFENNRFQVNQ